MVKTRFAPSPTGYLHLGNARTAIFSYLYARHSGGTFVLRIEDTDRERSTEEYEEGLIEDLRWLGLEWDEFYRQSERLEIYREYGERLVKDGHAYPCFCTPEELEKERQEAARKGIAYRYSGRCRNLSEKEVQENIRKGKPYALRFRVPDGEEIVFEDLIKGHISINVDDFGDFIIVRSDGMPTYNFVVVVDDALMGITHVIRGEDHISNTPKQILIYRALGFEVPRFAHLPVILGPDRSKLSKRHGGVSVKAYREEGILSEALFNYLCLLGWSSPEEDREIYTREELIKLFDLKDVNSSPAVFDRQKLLWMNGLYIREVLSPEEVALRLEPFLREKGIEVGDREYLTKVVTLTRDSFDTLREGAEKLEPFFRDPEISEEIKDLVRTSSDYIREFLDTIEKQKPSTPEEIMKIGKAFLKEKGIKPPLLWKPIRGFLTGSTQGIGIDILLTLIPLEVVKRRFRKALEV